MGFMVGESYHGVRVNATVGWQTSSIWVAYGVRHLPPGRAPGRLDESSIPGLQGSHVFENASCPNMDTMYPIDLPFGLSSSA